MAWPLLIPYLGLAVLAVAWHLWRRRRQERQAAAEQALNLAAGLNEPASLHPVVDPALCIGSGSCVRACPEQALGLVDGKARLINASACIGHGACQAACPFEAIRLVFGTVTRGVDIPLLSPDFETNVPGIYIAGELGGMGLIRKAAEQGRQAVEAIARRLGNRSPEHQAATPPAGPADALDLLIIGAGPAGLSASLSAQALGLRHKVLEQEAGLGGAIFHYPRQKVAMTAPVQLALVGRVPMTQISKEDLLAFWQSTVARFRLPVVFQARMLELLPASADPARALHQVRTTQGVFSARAVLLAIGRRGTPRTLDVPGEDLPKVVYRLDDPQQYAGQRVLVVGGGDSALEAAIALADVAGTTVSLSYRGEAFSRVKARNREDLARRLERQGLNLLLKTVVRRIEQQQVVIQTEDGQELPLGNDAVIVCAGGQLPTPLLQRIGIRFETRHGET